MTTKHIMLNCKAKYLPCRLVFVQLLPSADPHWLATDTNSHFLCDTTSHEIGKQFFQMFATVSHAVFEI
jgi:hypothetical protein